MKTLRLILLTSLLTGVYFINAFGQGKGNAMKATQGWTTGTYWLPVYCDGEQVDELSGGTLLIHYTRRWVPYVIYKEIDQIKGEVTSSATGEVFKIRETDKWLGTIDSQTITCHFNLAGNQGTHYHGILTLDMYTFEIIDISNISCN
ncbi:MAG TPA: hypothetical protein VKA38_11495 [Draconibacterium sp.]|nr:hypothetical protein [Draconibacterium sp.]